MSKLSELKKLHDKGMSLIFLKEADKMPLEKGWTKQKRKTWEELEASHEKRYNVGVRLGEPSKLISGQYLGAIDCDVKAQSRAAKNEMNEKLRQLGIDLKTAPIVMSGRGNGSKHIYVQTEKPMVPMKFATSEKIVKVKMVGLKTPFSKRENEGLTDEERAQGIRLRPAWEIAFMGTGQQTVLPPSIHPDTRARYAWANPLTVKYLPSFDPSWFVAKSKENSNKKHETRELDFQAEKVNLYESNIPIKFIQIIETGKGINDRSADLLTVTLSMCRHGFTDNQILSVLSDPKNYISQAAYDHTKSNSRLRAVKWLNKYTLSKARYETSILRRFENPPEGRAPLTEDEAVRVASEAQEIRDAHLPDLDGKGKPKPTLRNMIHIMDKWMLDGENNDEEKGGLIGFNEFSKRLMFLKSTPYGGIKGQEVLDHHDLSLKAYMAEHYRFEPSTQLCFEAHNFIARKYAFHPVKEYLEGLKWDGKPRLDDWLTRALGATGPKEYVQAIARKTLVAAVSRVFEPGCKFDYVLVLEGFQGKGKSTALNILAGDKWFTDGLGDIHQKDVVDQMSGKWIIELGELAQVRRVDAEFLKAFLTRKVDRVRLAYGRRSEDFPRSSIFIGTTNSDEYLIDETGNRRIWPVQIKQADFKWLEKNRDQLWAEAKIMYTLGEELYLEDEIEALAKKEQAKRFMVDELEGKVKTYLNEHHGDEKKMTTTLIWQYCEDAFGVNPTQAESARIGKIMRRLNYHRQNLRMGGVYVKGWVKRS